MENKKCDRCDEKANEFLRLVEEIQPCYYDTRVSSVLNIVKNSFKEIFEIKESS